MKLNELQPNDGAVSSRKRVGRGIGSGKGKTCGVGQKGQKSRSGVAINGYEGGQMPLFQRLPKRGFNNSGAKKMVEISLGRLQEAIDKKMVDAKGTIDEAALAKGKVIKSVKDGVRLLGSGELKSKVNLQLSGATKGAVSAVEKAGGKIEIVKKESKAPLPKRGGPDSNKEA